MSILCIPYGISPPPLNNYLLGDKALILHLLIRTEIAENRRMNKSATDAEPGCLWRLTVTCRSCLLGKSTLYECLNWVFLFFLPMYYHAILFFAFHYFWRRKRNVCEFVLVNLLVYIWNTSSSHKPLNNIHVSTA